MKDKIDIQSMHQFALKSYIETLSLKNYSIKTIKNYKNNFNAFLNFYSGERPSEISKENVIKYLLYIRNKKNWSASEQNGTINAIKFFYEKVLNRPKEVYDIPRAKKPFQLPEVYSGEEIMKIINAAKNLKHRCIICAANAGGMSVRS